MIERFVIKLIVYCLVEANVNEYIRIDTSAPELEIDQHEYKNPYSLKKNLSEKSIAMDNKLTIDNNREDISKEDLSDIEKVELENSNFELDNKITKAKPEILKEDDYIETMWQETKFIESGDIESKEFISVATKDVPKARIMGPHRKPDPEPRFNGVGPKGMDDGDTITCNEFSRNARFNPYSVTDDQWFCFYRWAPDNVPLVLEFFAPTSWEIANMRKFLDKQLVPRDAINWTARMVIMVDLVYNSSSLLVERRQNGMYWLYPIRPNYTDIVTAEDIRLKQTADNKYIAFVLCQDQRAFILSRKNEIPLRKKIPDAVATIGWRGRDGQSYLYQGHQWMPIPEMDEAEYWAPEKYSRKEELPPDPEPYDPATDTVEIFGKRHNHLYGKSEK